MDGVGVMERVTYGDSIFKVFRVYAVNNVDIVSCRIDDGGGG